MAKKDGATKCVKCGNVASDKAMPSGYEDMPLCDGCLRRLQWKRDAVQRAHQRRSQARKTGQHRA